MPSYFIIPEKRKNCNIEAESIQEAAEKFAKQEGYPRPEDPQSEKGGYGGGTLYALDPCIHPDHIEGDEEELEYFIVYETE